MRRFSTSSTTSTTQRRMFPPSLPAPPYPTPDLFPVKFQPRRTSAPAVSNRGNIDIDRSCQNKTHHSHIETISSNMYHENLVNSLSPKYSPQSPPQSIIAESVSHSEFNSLLVANENFSSETSFINKMKNDSISKSNLSQLSEESLLTALVRCQNISEDCINSPLNKKLNSNTQQSTNSSSRDIQCSVKLPDPEYLNHELVTNNDNSSKNISNTIVFNGTYSSTLDKKIKKCSNQSSISNNQKLTLFEQSILDKQNLSKVELAKRCWENYFRPKPPRIARKKTLQDDSINQSMNIGSIHGKSFRSNSTDCTFRNYDNKMETKDNTIQQKYNDNLQTTQLQCLSTPLSPILSSNDNISTIDSQCSLKDNINQSDDSITSKYTKKGYSPSFIRLIVANELDNSKQLETNLYDLPRNIEQVNCQHSTSTLTLTEITTPTKEYESRMNSIDSNEINEKRLYQSNIEFTNYDKDIHSEDLLNVIRPQSVTLQRHCIHLIDKHRKLTCTSLNDYETTNKMHLSNKNNLNKNNKNDIIQTLKKYSYPISDSATQTDIHLNKHAHWSRLHVEEDRLIRNINKKYKRHNTFIDHFQLPVEKNVNYIRSYSADYNPLKSYSKYNSLSIGIERSESFYHNVKHISSSVELKKTNELSCNHIDYPENNLQYITSSSSSSSSLYSPVSTSSLIRTSVNSTSIISNDSFQLLKKKRQFSSVESDCKVETISLKDKTTNNLKTFCNIHSVDSAKNCNVNPSDDKNLINSVYSEYDHEDDQFNDKLSKMSLSPAARRYEEHVLATVSGRPYNKSGNQLQFADHKNYVTQQNSIKNVKILPEYHYNNKSIEVIKDSNYDEEESDSVYHQNDEQLNAELWREKLGAITRWRREVDNAMLAGETDLKEIFSSPDNTLHNSFIEKEFNLTHMPNQHDTIHYLQPTSSSVNPPSLSDLDVNYSTTYGLPLEQSKNHIKPLVQGKIGTISTNQHGSYQSNNLKSHTHQMNSQIKKNMTLYDNSIQKNYQSTSQAVPSKVVINPSGVLNDHIYHYDNNIHLEKPPQITSQYQPMWIKASKPQASFSRQQQQQPSFSNYPVVQPIKQIQNSLNTPYYSSNIPVNLTSPIPTSINSCESNHLSSNVNSSKNRHKSSTTVKSFRNFFTPKLRRKTYELDKTESGELKQDYYLQANKLLNNSGGHYAGNNSKSSIGINNQFKKVVPSASYTEALNLAVAANTALYEAFHQQSIDSYNKMNSVHHNTPTSFKQHKFKSSTPTINPGASSVTNGGFPNEISSILRETVETEHKNKPCQWTKVIKPHKNISLSPISQFNGDENSSVEKQTNTDKLKSTTVEQTLDSDNKCRSPRPILKEKSNDLMDSSAETRRTTGRPRSSYRHAVTLSPYRRKPDIQTSEQCNSPYLDPSSMALSSGFVSAGSIVNAVDESTEKMNKDELTETSSKVRSVPPPVGVHDYPIVTNLEKDLNTIDSLIDYSVDIPTNTIPTTKSYQQLQLSSNSFTQKQSPQQRTKLNRLPPLQALPPCKLLLGRVASNEDICIETETPIAFNIAATDKEICITRVASVDDLKYQHNNQFTNQNNSNNHSIKTKHKRIPISLRLTFGSESKLNKSTLLSNENDESTIKHYRAMYYVNLPHDIRTTEFKCKVNNQLKSVNQAQNITRYSLPCITYCEELPKPISLLTSLNVEKNR